MDEPKRPAIYTLPFGADICDVTVDLVMQACGDDPLSLTEALIFLPNNRAIRAMTESFVRRAAPGLLMPRMVAIGDLALDESLGALLDPLDEDASIPALIGPLQRQLLLAGLVRAHRKKIDQKIDATEAMRLARLLAELIDELDIEQITLTDFQAVSDDRELTDDPDLAEHWQNSYAMLMEILPEYRSKMDELGMDGPAARRNLLLSRLEKRLQRDQPKTQIFASGISTAAPAIANLLKRIAAIPSGHVVLPPVDLEMADDGWEALGPFAEEDGKLPKPGRETHPQFHLKLLLERMSVNRREISYLDGEKSVANAGVPQIFCLPEASVGWNELKPRQKRMPNLRAMVAEDSAEEARAIAILVREALEDEEKRIAVATPDRELAIRISSQLKRWDIEADDSAGQPLLQTPSGTLLMSVLRGIADRFSPVSVLAIAKHPLIQAGDGRLDWLEKVRALDLMLRGPSSGSGLSAITKLLAEKEARIKDADKKAEMQALNVWWREFSDQISELELTRIDSFPVLLGSLSQILESMTGGAIWKGAAGRRLAALFEELVSQEFAILGEIQREALPELFMELASGQVVRPPYGGHPRVALLGLLEARLQPADLLICAGLNEGSWPQLPQPDPWLAPRIRRQLGLPALERNIGLSAHDLATAMGAKECVITRAKRDRSGPTVSSRFLLRIEAYLGDALQHDENAIALARGIDAGEDEPFAKPPEVRPDASQRLVDLSVTDFDRLLADPFAFYARKILRVPPLDDVDEEPGAAWRGTMIHDLLERWAVEDKCVPEKLMARADAMLCDADLNPNLRVLWQPRITEALQWIAEETSELFKSGRSLAGAEIKGRVGLTGITITGRADRIDQDAEGNLIVIDYKTGKAPAVKQIRAGFALQLGLLGGMADNGAFEGVKGTASGFEYWSLAKEAGEFGKRKSAAGGRGDTAIDANELVAFMQGKAIAAIESWINGGAAFEAKLHPEYAPYADYDQLSRLQEWAGRQAPNRSMPE